MPTPRVSGPFAGCRQTGAGEGATKRMPGGSAPGIEKRMDATSREDVPVNQSLIPGGYVDRCS